MFLAAVLVLDAANGRPQALWEGGTLTAIRTGAASGAATDLLARPDSRVAAIFGAGVQARTQLEAVCTVRAIETVFVVDPSMEKAAVFAAPIRFGSGIQNKVLEAMAMEVPVVTRKIVADGLYLDNYGEPPLITAAGDSDFAQRIIWLLNDAKERTRLARAGRKFIENTFNWTKNAKKLETLC